MSCRENQGLTPRPVRESASEYAEMALPNDANPLGNLLGGKVMHLVDMAGALAAMRHARCQVVTASIDSMSFLHPVHIGQLVSLRSSVNRAYGTSREVGVKVMAEDLTTGEVRHTSSAYVTFVAVDAEGRPVQVPPVVPETEQEKRRYREACERRTLRLQLNKRAGS
jgi:acyl-CoA hydrolase